LAQAILAQDFFVLGEDTSSTLTLLSSSLHSEAFLLG